jgi:RNase H-like domain found in reverse transcriptase/Reverse transcriptase (RNA-dependent DNA polymerase)/Integrase zinc binding domain
VLEPLQRIDLSRTMGGLPFTFSCVCSLNDIGVSTKALVDTGASAYILASLNFTNQLASRLSIELYPLPKPVPVRGYDGNQGVPATHYFITDFSIEGRIMVKVPIVVLAELSQDLLVGATWLGHHRVLPDVANHQLIWQKDSLAQELFRHLFVTPSHQLPTGEQEENYQKDADRRDQLFEDVSNDGEQGEVIKIQEIKSGVEKKKSRHHRKRTELSEGDGQKHPPLQFDDSPSPYYKYWKGTTHRLDTHRGYKRMELELSGISPTSLSKLPNKPRFQWSPDLPIVDIALVNAVCFKRRLDESDTELFSLSLHELDILIEERKAQEEDAILDEEENEEAINQRLDKRHLHQRDVFSKQASNEMPPHRPFDHKIKLTQPNNLGPAPLYQRSSRELEATKKYIIEHLNRGFIEPSSAPWGSPILFAAKPGGGLRFCVDYRKLNAITERDEYPIPLIDECLAQMAHAKVFTKLDIRQAFHRVRMAPEDEELTTFRTRYGSFKCKVLPFGLTNGPATYQRFMNSILFDCLDVFCTAYLDDILIYSANEREHTKHVNEVLNRLRAAGLQCDIKKSEFYVTRTKFLGFIITTDGVEIDPEKTVAIENWEFPTTIKGTQSFLGFCNFYRRFIPNYSRVAKPLHQLTRLDVPFKFDETCKRAFRELKRRIIEAPCLTHFQPDRQTVVETDASDGVVAGILWQICPEDDALHPVAFFSKTMQPAELNYAIHDKELLAIVRALEEWRPHLQSCTSKFKILTDHRALEYFMSTKALTARQVRWAELLSMYHFIILYKSGSSNRVDALTRRDQEIVNSYSLKLSSRVQTMLPKECLDARIVEDLKITSPSAAEVGALDLTPDEFRLIDEVIKLNRESITLEIERDKAKFGEDDNFTLDDGLLLYQDRLVIPDENGIRARLIKEVHSPITCGHPGIRRTEKVLLPRFYWRGMRNDISTFVNNCALCKLTTTPKDKIPGLLKPGMIADHCWQHISMDFLKVPRAKTGENSIFVVVDRLGKRPISIPCTDKATAKDVAWMFIERVWRYYGAPLTITSDRGPQFIADFWREFNRILGTHLNLSTAYHPQTDGQTEIYNQYLIKVLTAYVNYYQDDWPQYLPAIDFGFSTHFQESIGMTPFQLELGYLPRLDFDWKVPDPKKKLTPREIKSREEAEEFAHRLDEVTKFAQGNLRTAQERQARQANKHRREVDWVVGDDVWVSAKHWHTLRPSKKLDYKNAGPFPILEEVNGSYRIKLPQHIKLKHDVFHPEKLRKSAKDRLTGQKADDYHEVEVNEHLEYEVDKIIASRIYRRKLQYKVLWIGSEEPDENFYDAVGFVGSPHKLRDFHIDFPNASGPPLYLNEWLDAFESGHDEPPGYSLNNKFVPK